MTQPASKQIDTTKLHRLIVAHFSDDELRTLCFDLGVDYENLPPGGKEAKARELITHCQQHRRLDDLVAHLSQTRPTISLDNILRDASDDSPFMGLRYFDESHAHLFFGREDLTEELVHRIFPETASFRESERFLAIVGASGSGKSSIARAGLVPAIRQQNDWPIHIITPGSHPLKALAANLTRDSESVTAAATLMDDMAKDRRSLDLYVTRFVGQFGKLPHKLLLVIDQFEELFTLCKDEAERRAFVDNLMHAAAANGPTTIILTLRADFYDHCAPYDQLREALAQHQAYIGPMNAAELRQAIERPAANARLTFEEGLIDLLLRDVGATGEQTPEPGALPLLSHALLETWRRREGDRLTLAGYNAAGGVHGAIAQTAETVYQTLPPEQQTIARNIFLRLTELGEGTQDTRRHADLDELITRPEVETEVSTVLRRLADTRLVTTSNEGAEVAHEALIREWPTLRRWLDDNREGLRIHRQLTEAATTWTVNNQDNSYLYRGARLETAQEWSKNEKADLNQRERAFLEASQERQQNELAQAEASAKRLRRLSYGLAVALALMIGALFLAFSQLRAAQARQLLTQAQIKFKEDELILSALLALESNRLIQTSEATDLLGEIPYARPDTVEQIFASPSDRAWGVAWSPDGRLASGSVDGVIIWDEATGKPAKSLSGHSVPVTSVAWSPDGRLASGSADGTIIIWDEAAGSPAQTLSGHSDIVMSLAWSPDGRLASSSLDRTVIIWDVGGRQPNQTFSNDSDPVISVAWSPDGRLTSGLEDGTIIIWNETTGQPAQIFSDDSTSVISVAWSPDGRLASGSDNGTVIIWNEATGAPAQTFSGHSGSVYSAAWSPNGRLASSSKYETIIWDEATGTPAQNFSGHTDSVNSVAWSPDNRLASSSTDGMVIIWNEVAPAQNLIGHSDWVNSVAWSSDDRLASGDADGTIIIWDKATGLPAKTFSSDSVISVAWSPNGRLASGLDNGTVIIWDLAAGQPAQILTGHSKWVSSVAWSPDGRLASGSAEGIIWDLRTGTPSKTLYGSSNWVSHVAWSPSNRLASSSGVIIWDITTKSPEQIFSRSDSVNSVAWSPDGRLASGSSDGTVIIWDEATGQPAQILTGHSGSVRSIAWSPNGRLASGSDDRTVIIWDEATGTPAQILTGHSGSVRSIAWSSDGRLASGSDDRTIKIVPEIFTHPTCDWLYRNLTEKEWLQYKAPFSWSGAGTFFTNETTAGQLVNLIGLTPYHPTCPNLPTPEVSPILTQRGRLFYGGAALLALAVLVLAVIGLVKLSKKIVMVRLQR